MAARADFSAASRAGRACSAGEGRGFRAKLPPVAEPSDPADDTLAEGLSLPPGEIVELAEAAREYVVRALNVELDYTAETLPLLDHYIGQARENVRERPELVELLTRSVGAYFGEVVRRAMPSFWRLPSDDAHEWQLCFEEVFLAFNPAAFAWDALFESTDHAGPSSELYLDREDREALEKRLAALPPVSEGEYWLLSTRFEVVEMAADQARIELGRAGLEHVSYGPADYEPPKPIGQA